jgi:hypothetical protein
MTYAEFNVQMTAILGAIFLWVAHHGEMLFMGFFKKREDWGYRTEGSLAETFGYVFSRMGLHFSGSIALEIGALVFYTFSLRDNAEDRSASMQDNSSMQSIGSNEFKWLLTFGFGTAVIGRIGTLLIHSHKTDLVGGSVGKIAAFICSQLMYVFGWLLLGMASTLDKKEVHQYIGWFGGALIGTSAMLISILHWGRARGPYDHPGAKFANIFVRLIWNTGGIFLFTWACLVQVESAA